jgi:hypothetical protein
MTTSGRLSRLAPLAFLFSCTPESDQVTFGFSAMSFTNSEWSAPVNLGAVINSAATENNMTLSPDDLSLYFTSNRAGGLGANDIWVSRRACVECPWGTPMNLGTPINSAGNDAGPTISLDGHVMFFHSSRAPEGGAGDIYVSHRTDPNDDLDWGSPVRLGPEVNTPAFEAGAEYVQSAEDGTVNLYFGRQPVGGVFDVYQVAVTRAGEVRGPARLVPELSPGTGTTIRTDGREVIFLSSRAGSLGLQDLWVSTRRSVHDPWSAPVNPGGPLNTAFIDRHPSLSADARTMIFASDRPGGFGGEDVWMVTRTVNGR